MQWLKYQAQHLGIKIQNAYNGKEKVIGPYKVDGFYQHNGEKIVLEFHDHDFLDRNLECYSASTFNPVCGLAMGELCKKQLISNNI